MSVGFYLSIVFIIGCFITPLFSALFLLPIEGEGSPATYEAVLYCEVDGKWEKIKKKFCNTATTTYIIDNVTGRLCGELLTTPFENCYTQVKRLQHD